MQKTPTGREQFSKLVNSKHPIQVNINLESSIVYTNKEKTRVQFGKTDNERWVETDENGKNPKVGVDKSTIKLNIITIDAGVTQGTTFGSMDVTGLTLDEFLGAVFGHEIEHTTVKNNEVSANGGDAEKPAYQVSDKIITEIKEAKKAEEQQKQKN